MGYRWWAEEPDDVPRNLAAAVTGVATGLLGTAVPIIGFAAGIVIQVAASDLPSLRRFEYPIEGIVDGSAALLAKAIFR